MLKPLITIEDASGGNTLNKRLGGKNNSFRSFGVNGVGRQGSILPSQAFVDITGGDPNNNVSDIEYDTKNGDLYFAMFDTLFVLSSPSSIGAIHNSTNTNRIVTLKRYLGYLYYFQRTTVGRRDLNSLAFSDNFQTGVTGNGNHPAEISADNFLYIGAGQYLDKIDTSNTYSQNVLDLQDGWDIIALANFGIPFIAIGANFIGNISDSTKCKVFLWDRISPSWNDEVEIPEEQIYAMISTKGGLWIFAGSGSLSVYYVGLGTRTAVLVHAFENLIPMFDQISMSNNAVTASNGRVYFGYSADTSLSDQSIPAVYSFNPNPRNFQLQGEYLPLTVPDDNTNPIKVVISCVKNAPIQGGRVFVSQKDDTTFYIAGQTASDVNPFLNLSSNVYFESITYEAPAGKKLSFDGFGADFIEGDASRLKVQYKKDLETTWTQIDDRSVTGKVSYWKEFALTAYKITFRLIPTTAGRTAMSLSRFYGTGIIIDDTR